MVDRIPSPLLSQYITNKQIDINDGRYDENIRPKAMRVLGLGINTRVRIDIYICLAQWPLHFVRYQTRHEYIYIYIYQLPQYRV